MQPQFFCLFFVIKSSVIIKYFTLLHYRMKKLLFRFQYLHCFTLFNSDTFSSNYLKHKTTEKNSAMLILNLFFIFDPNL